MGRMKMLAFTFILRRIYGIFLFIPLSLCGLWMGNGKVVWLNIEYMGAPGISRSHVVTGMGVGGRCRFEPALGIDFCGLGHIATGENTYLDKFLLSPYVRLYLPLTEYANVMMGVWYLHMFAGKWIFSDNSPYHAGCEIGYQWCIVSAGLEAGVFGGNGESKSYVGFVIRLGGFSPQSIKKVLPEIAIKTNENAWCSLPPLELNMVLNLPSIIIEVKNLEMKDAVAYISGDLGEIVERRTIRLGKIAPGERKVIKLRVKNDRFIRDVTGKIIVSGKDPLGETVREELELPVIRAKDMRRVEIVGHERRGTKIYFRYKLEWEEKIPKRFQPQVRAYVVAKYKLKGEDWVYTDNVFGDINKEVGYGEHEFYWDLEREFPVEQTLEDLEFEVEIKK